MDDGIFLLNVELFRTPESSKSSKRGSTENMFGNSVGGTDILKIQSMLCWDLRADSAGWFPSPHDREPVT